MNAVARRLVLLFALAIVGTLADPSAASAQPTLQVVLFENPFLCDTVVRPLGTVSGLTPGETVEFSSPQLNGVFSRRSADALGQVDMRWNCDTPRTWSVTIRALSSGGTASFTLESRAAPPPPDAPIGAAFDNKTALSTSQMAIWKDFSPFSAAGIYIPVSSSFDNRADKVQSNLTAGWVNEVFADGWSLIPIYVGLQAPAACETARYVNLSSDPATARNQGLAAAADAVNSVTSLGIGPGNPIYYDMEAYRPGCAAAVLAFLDAWTEGVHAAGYLSGVYGSRSSTMADLSAAFGRSGFDSPDAVWVSTGNGEPTTFGLEIPTDGLWTNARMHQYRLNITRTYGGVTVEIDENVATAPLARPNAAPVPAPTTPADQATTDSDGDGIAEPEPDNCDSVANPDQADQDGDGDGDICDRDRDGDGVDNVLDIAPDDPTVTSAEPAATAEPTAVVEPTAAPTPAIVADAVVDSDGDGFAEPEPDNCDSIANPDQADLDNDGDGDVCDSDIDGDGVANDQDQEPRDPFIGAEPTPQPPTEAASDPDPAPTVEPTSDPDPQPAAETPPAPEPTPAPTTEPTTAPAVIILPTPEPTVTPSPTAVQALPAGAPDESTTQPLAADVTQPEAATQGSQPLASETVTITVQRQSPLVPIALASLALFSMFCVGMGVRSFRSTRVS